MLDRSVSRCMEEDDSLLELIWTVYLGGMVRSAAKEEIEWEETRI